MGLVPQFDDGVVRERVKEFSKRMENSLLVLLKALGEELVRYARDQHNYTDRTGNLTSSIGYVIAKGGEVVFDGITYNDKGLAMKVVSELVSQKNDSFTLIVVAGMEYASYVESQGYNVILPAELKAKKEFPVMMARFVESARKKANNLFS